MPPDTVLGIRGPLGQIDLDNGVDDDSSHLGNGGASGMYSVATNSGSINFAVTGFPNYDFASGHDVVGEYQVFVEVYDDFHEEPIALFDETRTMESDAVHEFSYFNEDWLLGTYNVFIDNTIGPGAVGDVDFFTFTGLTPGEAFTAETLAPGAVLPDTYLGWFDAAGALIDFNDDVDELNLLSLVAGTVPADGRLTFAVTGVGDDEFNGDHMQQFPYELRVTTTGGSLPGDFNGDQVVDGDDVAMWRDSFGPGAMADADGDSDTDGDDFLVWQRAVGGGLATAAISATPEPHSGLLMLLAALFGAVAKGRRQLVG